MKGDFTRFTFKPEKHYAGVLAQQGRVELDASRNEQAAIEEYLRETEGRDTIGRSGVPKTDPGFAIGVAIDSAGAVQDLTIAPGRIYVDGILCEPAAIPIAAFSTTDPKRVTLPTLAADGRTLAQNDEVEVAADGVDPTIARVTAVDVAKRALTLDVDVSAFSGGAHPRLRRFATFTKQPDFPGAQPDPGGSSNLNPVVGRTDLVYLDVWRRHVTAVEDPSLLEEALNGADTTTRLKTVWQVRVRQNVGNVTCADDIAGWPPPASGARLTNEVIVPSGNGGPCFIPPGGGYRGLENRLYRVEVHSVDGGSPPAFKWSRDNGSAAFAIEEFVNPSAGATDRIRVRRLGRDQVLALRKNDVVEVLDDATELTGKPGTLVQVFDIDEGRREILLSAKVSGYDVSRHAKIRRWDGGATTITTGSAATLEDGIRVTFTGSGFRPGDYWTFAARTATGDVDRLYDAAPQGIDHHYGALALVTWQKDGTGTWAPVVDDCRRTFPPLTEVTADDVFFDNSTPACNLVTTTGTPAETVQDALEVLCDQHQLRHHNAYLHGWGIVSGVKVLCDDGNRSNVKVGAGWIIDPLGNDVEIRDATTTDGARSIPFLQLVNAWDADPTHTTKILNQQGNGDAWLTLKTTARPPAFGVEPYDPKWNAWDSRLEGTLLMDFYDHCIKPVHDFWQSETTPAAGDENLPAGPVQQRVAALTNLFAQRVNPQAGQHILISPREHAILKAFYSGLKDVLESETFCGLFDDARPYPADYPQELAGIDTIFSKGEHLRLRVRPDGKEAYSVGPGINPKGPATTINRYDLENNVLVAQLDPMAGADTSGTTNAGVGSVLDVAFSKNSKQIHVVAATKSGQDTLFRTGDIGDEMIKWGNQEVICGAKLVSLATTPADPGFVYAIGMTTEEVNQNGKTRTETRGLGLYRIDPANIDVNPQPIASFNACGHLKISASGIAYATAAEEDTAADTYTRVELFRVPSGAPVASYDLSGDGPGSDDIAFVERGTSSTKGNSIYAVVGPNGNDKKSILALSHKGGTISRVGAIEMENTAIRLEAYAPTQMLVATAEDGYAVRLIDTNTDTKVENFVPMQVGPIGMATTTDRVFVANYASNTITTADGRLFAASPKFPVEALAQYRKEAVEAFADLAARFTQYLKDCLCDEFLLDGPDQSGDGTLYLAAVTIRQKEGAKRVYKICNLSRRRYVKSFPALGYWLSLVPMLQVLGWALARFCGLNLLDATDKYQVGDYDEDASLDPVSRLMIGSARNRVAWAQGFDALGAFGEIFGKILTAGNIFRESTGSS